MPRKIDCTPKTGLVRALANQNLDWRTVICEFIDNAFDADARDVFVSTAQRRFVVKDDGNGSANIAAFFTLGDRQDHSTTRSGRYGIGAKDGILWIGGERCVAQVTSHHGGKSYSGTMDFSEAEATGKWDGIESDPRDSDERGTEISVTPMQSDRRAPDQSRLVADLAYIYFPALARGRKIRLRLGASRDIIDVPAWKRPRFEDGTEVEITHVFEPERAIKIKAGLVAAGEKNPRSGLTYAFGFRVLPGVSTQNGCGAYDSARICGVVELVGKKWKISKNKDALTKFAEELFSAVEDRLRPLLERADHAAHTLESEAIRDAVESQLNALVAPPDRKAKRDKGDDRGTVTPADTKKKHRRAKNEQPGKTFNGCRARAVRLTFITGWERGDELGRVEAAKTTGVVTVQLFRDHPMIAVALKEQKRELVANIALMHLAASMHVPDGMQVSMFSEEAARTVIEISRSYASLTEAQVFMDGRHVIEAAAAE